MTIAAFDNHTYAQDTDNAPAQEISQETNPIASELNLATPGNTIISFFDFVPEQGVHWGDTEAEKAAACINWPDTEQWNSLSQRKLAMRALDSAFRHPEDIPTRIKEALLASSDTEWQCFPHQRFYTEDMDLLAEIQTEGAEYRSFNITLAPDAATSEWRFTEQTITDAIEFSRLLRPLTPEYIASQKNQKSLSLMFPNSMREKDFIGVKYWQWCSLALLIIAGLILDVILRLIISGVVANISKHFSFKANPEAAKNIGRGLSLFTMAWIWLSGLPWIGLPGIAQKIILAAAVFFVIFSGVMAAWRVIDGCAAYFTQKAEETENKLDDILVPMLSKAFKILACCLSVVYGAHALQIEIVPLLTGLGIGGLAFAFAAKDTIENFFGSMTVILDRPFEVGDWVVIDGKTEGTVELLGFRSTRIRTFYNSQITVPNATLVRATVDNYGRRRYRRWKTTLSVQYDTSPEKLIAFTEGIRELVRSHPYTRKDYFQVWCNEFNSSSLDILVYIFFETPDWTTELRERERFFVDVIRLADSMGVKFAFPTQTLHLQQQDNSASAEQQYTTPNELSDKRAMVEGIRKARNVIKEQQWQQKRPGPYQFENADGLLDEAGNATLAEDPNTPDEKHGKPSALGGESGE